MKVIKAKEKICPFMSGHIETNCKVSDCMAWEYTQTSKIHYCDNKPNNKCEEFIDEFLNNCWVEKLEENEREGYCMRLQK
jgi:hypothetical protein